MSWNPEKPAVPSHLKISVIVPFYNEEDSIAPLHRALVTALDSVGQPYEMVFVNDGSKDNTLARAEDLAKQDERVVVVNFRRNYGQTAAMAAGIQYATGDVLITMDGDLQNDPADIRNFLEKIEEGYDIVVGWRHRRQDKLITRKIPSRIANWLIGKVTGVPIRDNGCSLKAFRASLIKQIPLYSEMHRFIPAMAWMAGPRIAEIKVRHHARQFGQSKYGLSRIYKVLLDLMVIKTVASFTSRPLLWFCMVALPLTLIGTGTLVWSIFKALTEQGLSLPLAGTGIIFLSSAFVLVASGALGELVYKLGGKREYEYSRLTQRVWQSDENTSVLVRGR
jgi:glycosyltransferase involved in cell wall biosynthesis